MHFQFVNIVFNSFSFGTQFSVIFSLTIRFLLLSAFFIQSSFSSYWIIAYIYYFLQYITKIASSSALCLFISSLMRSFCCQPSFCIVFSTNIRTRLPPAITFFVDFGFMPILFIIIIIFLKQSLLDCRQTMLQFCFPNQNLKFPNKCTCLTLSINHNFIIKLILTCAHVENRHLLRSSLYFE